MQLCEIIKKKLNFKIYAKAPYICLTLSEITVTWKKNIIHIQCTGTSQKAIVCKWLTADTR